MKGYQFLENDFFDMCKTRKLRSTPMLLYIYLRGLYCRFQKPSFSWSDKQTREHLAITQTTLVSAKRYLQERALIKYQSGIGRTPTQYEMLGTILLPELRVLKFKTLSKGAMRSGSVKNCDTNNTSKERLKNRVGEEVFTGMTEKDREILGLAKSNK